MQRPIPTHGQSDEQLARRAQSGCRESFDELMRRYQAPLLHFLRARTAAAEAEDLLQETFLKAYRGLAGYREAWSLRTWLFTIARRTSIDAGRRHLVAVPMTEEVASAASDAATVASANEERSALWSEARRLLSEVEQIALWLHYVEEMPLREVAEVVGRSHTATKVMLHRARRTLAEHLPALRPEVADTSARRAAATSQP